MSNYSDVRKRLDAQRACTEAALQLAEAFSKAKGSKAARENDSDVLIAKARLLAAINDRDSTVSSAIEKQLAGIGLKQRTAEWIFADGVAAPEKK